MLLTFNQLYENFKNHFNNDINLLYFDETIMNKAEICSRVDEITKHLISIGVKTGTGVGYTLPNSFDVIPLFISIARLGAYAMPLFTGMPNQMKISLFEKAKVSYVVTTTSQLDGLLEVSNNNASHIEFITTDDNTYNIPCIKGDCLKNINLNDYIKVDISPDAPLLLASSSGTTGIPKMVILSQKNVGSGVSISIEMNSGKSMQEINPIGSNRIINVAFALSTSVMLVICGFLLSGDALCFSDDTSALHFIQNIDRWKCKEISCPPAYFENILLFKDKHNYDLSSLTNVSAGMDFCSPALLKRLKCMFPNLKEYTNGYGLVETCNVYMYTHVDLTKDEITNTATLTLADCSDNIIQIRDEDGNIVNNGEVGEIYVKGSSVISGYYIAKDKVLEVFKDGWFKTGDIACKLNDKTATLMGRKKFFIKRGGRSISPIVVQNAINRVDGVVESCVVGVPHQLYGEMIWAFIVKNPDMDVTLKDVQKQCRKDLPSYMTPDQISFIDSIPKTPNVRKVNFLKLRELAKEKLDRISMYKLN